MLKVNSLSAVIYTHTCSRKKLRALQPNGFYIYIVVVFKSNQGNNVPIVQPQSC